MTSVDLELTRPDAVLLPGATFHGTLTVRNTGPEVERFAVVPDGALARWTTVEVTELRLWPGDEARVAFAVAVPCAPEPPAGAATLGVLVTDSDGGTAAVEHPAEVAPCPVVALGAPTPAALWTVRHALVHVEVANDGNVDLPLRLLAADREGLVVWRRRPDGEAFQLPPGARVRCPVRLRLRRVSWLGKDKPREYAVTLLAPPESGSAPQETSQNGVVTQMPVVRKWWLAVFVVLMVLAFTTDDGLGSLFGFPGLVVGAAIVVAAVVRLLRVAREGRDRSRPSITPSPPAPS